MATANSAVYTCTLVSSTCFNEPQNVFYLFLGIFGSEELGKKLILTECPQLLILAECPELLILTEYLELPQIFCYSIKPCCHVLCHFVSTEHGRVYSCETTLILFIQDLKTFRNNYLHPAASMFPIFLNLHE